MAQEPRPKVVIVTGGSHGIGAGVVEAYRQLGWRVVSVARSHPESGGGDAGDLLRYSGDLTGPGVVDDVVVQAMDRFGRIDTLVNNAGIYRSKPFVEYTADDYASMVALNLTAFFTLTQRVVAQMLRQGGGHVVNITTTLVDVANSTVPSALTALTKGGVAAATRSLAIEHAARGVRVNAVSPGVIATWDGPVDPTGDLARQHPLHRVGSVEDVVRGILFLEASPFVTGEIVHIDGGQVAGR